MDIHVNDKCIFESSTRAVQVIIHHIIAHVANINIIILIFLLLRVSLILLLLMLLQ